MTADTRWHLQRLYLEKLQLVIDTKKPRKNPRDIRRIIKWTRELPVGVHRPGGNATWVWSDLHLRHAKIIEYCHRPFKTVQAMDAALMQNWRDTVGPRDTVLNGGDVALHGRLNLAEQAKIRRAPGRKLLVIGNHDFHRKHDRVILSGHEAVTGLLLIDSDPPMVLTHIPLDKPPAGWVNLYGHVHDAMPFPRTPHINVCVEHTEYRPLPLDALVALGKRLLGGDVPEGATTAERIRSSGFRLPA